MMMMMISLSKHSYWLLLRNTLENRREALFTQSQTRHKYYDGEECTERPQAFKSWMSVKQNQNQNQKTSARLPEQETAIQVARTVSTAYTAAEVCTQKQTWDSLERLDAVVLGISNPKLALDYG